MPYYKTKYSQIPEQQIISRAIPFLYERMLGQKALESTLPITSPKFEKRIVEDTSKTLDVIIDSLGLGSSANENESVVVARIHEKLAAMPHAKWTFLPVDFDSEDPKGNCTLKSLIEFRALTKLGIEAELCAPSGHAALFVRYQNGRLEYLDPDCNVQRWIPESTVVEIAGVECQSFTSENPAIPYQLFPMITEYEAIMYSFFDNYQSMVDEGVTSDPGFDCSQIAKMLTPRLQLLLGTKEWKQETERVNAKVEEINLK
ncbi:hypothetical protein KJ596_01960 [Patescibacteria group bacterium]|nr:hypothetical protein [Patescibacteria group bacterium]MBU1868000.1 hypothetical protein [Patescibacteria group bacterium]